jgi:MFS family permease
MEGAGQSRFRAMGRALKHRNYRLFFYGQGASLIGTWITKVATSWLVYRLTGSALLLGVVGFAGQVPTFVFSPIGGVLVDRSNRHRILVITQAASMLQSVLLAWFTLRGTITVGHIVVLQLFQGAIGALELPARQSFVVEMVEDRADVPNAIALNSTIMNGARLLGPAIAAVLIGFIGEGGCFALDAVSYLAVLASLLAMHVRPRVIAARTTHVLTDLWEGARYVTRPGPIRSILLLVALVSLTGVPTTVLMPIFAAKVYGGGPHTLGMLMSSIGVGAVVGALWLASRQGLKGMGLVLCVAGLVFGAGLVAFSRTSSLPLALLLLMIAGGGMMVQMATANTLLQSLVDEDKRGRVMSFYALAFFGMAPFGQLASGWAGAHMGAQTTVLIGGALTQFAGLVFLSDLPAFRAAARRSIAANAAVTS